MWPRAFVRESFQFDCFNSNVFPLPLPLRAITDSKSEIRKMQSCLALLKDNLKANC